MRTEALHESKNQMTSEGNGTHDFPACSTVLYSVSQVYSSAEIILKLCSHSEVATAFYLRIRKAHNSSCSSCSLLPNSGRILPIPVPKATSIPWEKKPLPNLLYWWTTGANMQVSPGVRSCPEVGWAVAISTSENKTRIVSNKTGTASWAAWMDQLFLLKSSNGMTS